MAVTSSGAEHAPRPSSRPAPPASPAPDASGEPRRADRAPRRSRRLTTLVYAVVAFLVLTLFVSGTATGLARLRNAEAHNHLEQRLLPAQSDALSLSMAYLDQEAGTRGYLHTGDPSFLTPYQSGAARAARLQARLDTLVGEDARARRLLAGVVAAGQKWHTDAAATAIAARRAGPVPVAELERREVLSDDLFDRLRGRLKALQARTDQLTQTQLEAIDFRQSVANVVAATAVAVAFLVAALWVPVLRRLLVRPLDRLQSQVEAVAAGEYDLTIEASGPAEIAAIAAAVETMRDNIVHSSQELVEAQEQLTLRDERDRMAADLHDLTIQRVFALGLALSSTAVREPRLAPLLEPLIEETDGIIRELRGVIFGIRSDPHTGSLRQRVGVLVHDSARGLGFAPSLEFTGPVDSACDDQLAGEVLAVLRETLSNVARHAEATEAAIRVAVVDSRLAVTVTDDGIGVRDTAGPGHGLGNLRVRAARLGGRVELSAPPGGGTSVSWQVPLAPPTAASRDV